MPIATGMLPLRRHPRALLQSIVDVARAIFGAKASSIFLYDKLSPTSSSSRPSRAKARAASYRRAPAGVDPRHRRLGAHLVGGGDDRSRTSREIRASPAPSPERTGYVPTMLMSAPLIHEEETMGVLPRPRPHAQPAFAAAGEMQLLGMFANHAAIGLDLLPDGAPSPRRCRSRATDREAVVARLAALLERSEDDAAALRLLEALDASALAPPARQS